MAEAEQVLAPPAANGRGLPAEVVLHAAELANPRFTPRELRLIKEHTGHSLSNLLADEDSDDKFVVFAWLKLRRMGHDPDWSAMEDVVLSFDLQGVVDPTKEQPPATSQSSAASGA